MLWEQGGQGIWAGTEAGLGDELATKSSKSSRTKLSINERRIFDITRYAALTIKYVACSCNEL